MLISDWSSDVCSSDLLFAAESTERRRAMLRSAMGQAITIALNDPAVIEIMVNADGVLRLDRLGQGRVDTGVQLLPAEVERIIRLVAPHSQREIHAGNPTLSAELPPRDGGTAGERFEGLLTPVALAASCAIPTTTTTHP